MSDNLPFRSVFSLFGIKPALNASGIYTDLGGSILSPEIWAAITEMNLQWVRMTDLLDRTGEMIAQEVGAQAARVTPGASAAIALGVGACIVGDRGADAWSQLPSTDGLRRRVVFQSRQFNRYKYAICARLPGADIVLAGNDDGTSEAELEALIADAAAVFIPAHLDGLEGVIPLPRVSELAHARNIPVIVDAAYMVYPTTEFARFLAEGADLVCISAKYMFGPNPGGFIYGRKDLIETVAGLDFTRFESGSHKPFGRVFKMSRYDVAATALALRHWMRMDHRERFATYRNQAQRFVDVLSKRSELVLEQKFFTMDERLIDDPINCVTVRVREGSGFSVQEIEARLLDRTPIILPFVEGDVMTVVMESVREGDEVLIAEAIAESVEACSR